MSEEQNPHTEEAIKERMQSEEFMNDAHNMLLAILEHASMGDALLTYMETLTFDNLTPEIWAKIVAGLPNMRVVTDLTLQQVRASATVFGDEDALGVIAKIAAEMYESNKES